MLIKHVLVFLVSAGLLAACNKDAPPVNRSRPTFPVVVQPVEIVNENTRVEAVGTSRALRSITLYPATSGEVVAVHFQPGQRVGKDAILLELDQRDERLAVDLARVRLQEAQRLYERYQRTAASGATLPTTLDSAKTELEAARIELDRAQNNLDDRSIKAPFAGHVGITDVDVGDRIQPSTAITTLDDRTGLLVSFAVPEAMVGKIQVGDAVEISTWNVAAARAFGEVIDIDSRINPDTRVFITRARVDNSSDALRPGMSFRVGLELEGDPYPRLPEVALQWGADGSYVWSVVDGQARRVPVNIVQRQRGHVLVQSNLSAGDWVVVEGIQRLRPGADVKPENLEQLRTQEQDEKSPPPGGTNIETEAGPG